jgi:hypothetical protein
VKFSLPAKLVGDHGLEVPLRGEDGLVAILEIFQGPPQPGKTPLGVVKGGVRLT